MTKVKLMALATIFTTSAFAGSEEKIMIRDFVARSVAAPEVRHEVAPPSITFRLSADAHADINKIDEMIINKEAEYKRLATDHARKLGAGGAKREELDLLETNMHKLVVEIKNLETIKKAPEARLRYLRAEQNLRKAQEEMTAARADYTWHVSKYDALGIR
jgi:hypothetical protein